MDVTVEEIVQLLIDIMDVVSSADLERSVSILFDYDAE